MTKGCARSSQKQRLENQIEGDVVTKETVFRFCISRGLRHWIPPCLLTLVHIIILPYSASMMILSQSGKQSLHQLLPSTTGDLRYD